VTHADPALTDLWLLLQINKAVTLGDLDRHEEAFAAARKTRQLADQAGSSARRSSRSAKKTGRGINRTGWLGTAGR